MAPTVNNPGSMLRTQTNGRVEVPHVPAWPSELMQTFGNGEVVPNDPHRFEPVPQPYTNDHSVPRTFRERVDADASEV